MSKKQNAVADAPKISDAAIQEQIMESRRRAAMDELKPYETPSYLVDRLNKFFFAYPDYQTQVRDILLLSEMGAQELRKFIQRPHKKVTHIFLDKMDERD